MVEVKLSMAEVLLEYSEWLDEEGFMRSEQETPADQRSHDQLVEAFLESQLENEGRNYDQLEIEFTDPGNEGVVPPAPGHTRPRGGMATRELRDKI